MACGNPIKAAEIVYTYNTSTAMSDYDANAKSLLGK
jgi:hypothetical protein